MKARRTRTVPIQVYVTEDERTELARIARKRGVTVSELVRAWVRRAAAASKRGAVHAVMTVDPRQLALTCPDCHGRGEVLGVRCAYCE